jgi:ParB-like chromosome segregation protein Spo0J
MNTTMRSKAISETKPKSNSPVHCARLAVTYVPTSSLKLNPKNPRLHTEKQVQQIARSIETFGFSVPIAIDVNLGVIAGHGRVLAARLLGLPEVPTISLKHLTQGQLAAFMLADNRLTENSLWDNKLLAEQFKFLCELDLNFDLEVTGFEMGEIDLIVDGTAPALEGENDPADACPATENAIPVSKHGDLWILGGIESIAATLFALTAIQL